MLRFFMRIIVDSSGRLQQKNFCSKCYKDFFLKQSKASIVTVVSEAKIDEPTTEKIDLSVGGDQATKAIIPGEEGASSEDAGKYVANRCNFCRKRVGLTGFKCKCGQTFCSIRRYSDAIAKANPDVKTD